MIVVGYDALAEVGNSYGNTLRRYERKKASVRMRHNKSDNCCHDLNFKLTLVRI